MTNLNQSKDKLFLYPVWIDHLNLKERKAAMLFSLNQKIQVIYFLGHEKSVIFFANFTKISYCLILYLFVSFIIFNKIWQNNNKTNISPPPKSQMVILLSSFIYIICGALEITQLNIIRIQYIQILF